MLSKIVARGVTRIFILVMALTLIQSCSREEGVEILWDHYGVPHIYGKNAQEMYYAFGWAQMHNHADLVLQLYAQARGSAAEYFGEKYLPSDKNIRLFNVPGQALILIQEQSPEFRTCLEAFVRGINDFADRFPGAVGEEFHQVLPVTTQDVAAHIIRIISLEFLAAEDIHVAYAASLAGSNAIAIAPSRSASGHAMLVMNPHLPWSDFFTWFEGHLISEGFNAYGVALVGIPFLSIAFNQNLGWTHTINPIDASDRYELILQQGGYLLDGITVPFDKREEIIRVKQKDGTLQEQSFEFLYSRHGPIVGQNDKKAYAVRIAGFENSGMFGQYHQMARASNLEEFEDALRMMQFSMFNVIYADKTGNILYLFNGNIPIRKEGDFAFWKGTIDGSTSRYIWKDTHAYVDLPRSLNPPSGFIQNCNDPPWTCTLPSVLDPEDYPAYMSSRFTPLRPQRALNLVKDHPSISFDELQELKHNTGMEAACRFLDDLLEAVKRHPDSTAREAAAILKEWDKKTEADSRGAVLFAHWWDQVRSDLFDMPWSASDPASTPDGIGDPKRAVDMLAHAAREVQKKYGSMNVAWGEVYRFRMNGDDYPANGGPGEYGIFRTIYYTEAEDHKKVAMAGETFEAVVEFGNKARAMVLLSYGNATQPGSKHAVDQLQMLSEKRLRPALLCKADVLKNTEERELLPIK